MRSRRTGLLILVAGFFAACGTEDLGRSAAATLFEEHLKKGEPYKSLHVLLDKPGPEMWTPQGEQIYSAISSLGYIQPSYTPDWHLYRITPKGEAAVNEKGWEIVSVTQNERALRIPTARLDITEVTGITGEGVERAADVRCHVRLTEVGQLLADGVRKPESDRIDQVDFRTAMQTSRFVRDEQVDLVVFFRRYDDGWRVERYMSKSEQ